MNVVVIIPFRDRGRDINRGLNENRVTSQWMGWQWQGWYRPTAICVRDDGRSGDEQFNRSAAYNRGIADYPDADVYVLAESDMLIDLKQVEAGVLLASDSGLVVPFTEYRYLSPCSTELVRRYRITPERCTPEFTMGNARSIGAINIVSRRTMDMVGQFDESFEGNWYDDDAMAIAFELCTGHPTAFIEGPAYHLYHLPGHHGHHLTPEDRAATRNNQLRLGLYRQARKTNNVARIRQLTAGLP